MKKSFEFSYCLGEVEYIDVIDNITESESEDVLITLINNRKVRIGERTEGTISFDDSVQPIVYNLDYQYCSQVGMDWGDDVWEDVQEEVQL